MRHDSRAGALLQGLAEALLTLDTPLRLTGPEASETSKKARLSPMGCSIMASVLSMSQVRRDAACRDMLGGCCCAGAWCPHGLQHYWLSVILDAGAAGLQHAGMPTAAGELGPHMGCSTMMSVQLTTKVPAASTVKLSAACLSPLALAQSSRLASAAAEVLLPLQDSATRARTCCYMLWRAPIGLICMRASHDRCQHQSAAAFRVNRQWHFKQHVGSVGRGMPPLHSQQDICLKSEGLLS